MFLQRGNRVTDGSNPAEAQRLVDALREIMDREAELPVESKSSIGVLSPFRAQVDRLQGLLLNAISPHEVDHHRLLVGTAHGFQGEERDIMMLSFNLDADAPHMSFRFAEREDVFNVAITRARNQQHLFTSIALEDLPRKGLLGKYIRHAVRRDQVGLKQGGSDRFMDQVVKELEKRGYQCFRAWPHAGMEIDLLIERDDRHMGLDLIGYPGRYAPAFEFERYKILQRSGMPLFPLPWHAWEKSRAGCLKAIEAKFGALHR